MKILYVFRLAVLSLLIAIAFKPVMVRPDPGLPTSWALLLDTSLSMKVKDPISRLDQVKELVPDVSKRFSRFKLFSFSDKVKEVTLKSLDSLSPSGRQTNIAQALDEIFKKGEFRGAVVLTDGRHVGPGDPVSQAASYGHPLLMVGFGNRSLFKDVAVQRIQSPPFAFKNVPTSLTAHLSVVGYSGKKMTVTLKQGPRVLGVQTMPVQGEDIESSVTFNWTPRSLGTKTLTVQVNQYQGEFSTRNNIKKVALDVGRDRFRVLYICGSPGPEYGFLRHQFKADPAVELVTFVILRNASNVVNVADSELSLIPFPTQDVLINQMATFDLIVFEEFSYQRFGLPAKVLYAIRKKVEDGGSFMIMGGEVMLGPRSPYKRPQIKEMIPVEFGDQAIEISREPLRFNPKALNHPILRLAQNKDRNREMWDAMPLIEEVALIKKVKPGATVLATVTKGGKEYPVLTVWKHGKGRVAVLTTRTTWRFSLLGGDKAGGPYAYQQFWKNMVLWLTHSDEFKSVRVSIDRKRIRLGEKERVRVWVYDEYFQPISDVDVRMQLSGPEDNEKELKAHQETKGVFAAPFSADQLGSHTAKAWVLREGKHIGRDQVKFHVVEGFNEEEDLRPDEDLMKELARATGGRFVRADEFSPDLFLEFNEDVNSKIGQKILIWNSPWFLTILLLLLIGEWILRKRRGLP